VEPAQCRVSPRIERSTVEPGQVERLSVTVFVGGDPGSIWNRALESTVAAAAGVDAKGGDQVVSVMPFDNTLAVRQEKGSQTQEQRDLKVSIGKNASAVFRLVISLLMTQSLFRARPAGDEETITATEIPKTRPIGPYASQAFQQQQPTQALADPASADPAGLATILRGLIREQQG
jgi:flagellar biosynthesis/type III secretory pathway M-ring protein FliF/YscJ